MRSTAIGRGVSGVALAVFAFAAGCVPAMASEAPIRLYDPMRADQFQSSHDPDTTPADAAARQVWAAHLAYDATLYGTVAVLEYRQMIAQTGLPGPAHAGFNSFAHGRDLAGPDYAPFKTPNADTLYSNAYLDLRSGPVRFDVPATAGRYYTANFLDIYGNATNISARTHGMNGGHFLIATTDWQGTVPPGLTLFRVTTPFMWILLRVLVNGPDELPAARALQDRFMLTPTAPAPATTFPDANDESAAGFLRIVDFVLRQNGCPETESALVAQWRGIGVSGARSVDQALADPEIRAGVEAGFADAHRVIMASIAQAGPRAGSWSRPSDIGRFGANYLYRAAINTLGTGANVIDENTPFTTFLDATGAPLDGTHTRYDLRLAPPPPARYFWSVTVYERATRALYPNAWHKYLVGDRTPGLKVAPDGSVTIHFAHDVPGARPVPNTLPIPAGAFYVAIRAQGPKPELQAGRWSPPAIVPEETRR